MSARYGLQAAPTFNESLSACGAALIVDIGMQLTIHCWGNTIDPETARIVQLPDGYCGYDFEG